MNAMPQTAAIFPHSEALLDALAQAVGAALADGKRPWVVVDAPAAMETRRALAARNAGFGATVSTLNAAITDLWNLHGDGRQPIDDALRRMLLWKALSDQPSLPQRAGTVELLARAAKTALPLIEGEDTALSPAEAAAVRTLETYSAQLDRNDLIEPSQAIPLLLKLPALSGYRFLVLDTPGAAQPKLHRQFIDSVDAHVLRNEALERPHDDGELGVMARMLYRRTADDEPLQPHGAIRLALAAGPSADERLIGDVIEDVSKEFSDGTVTVCAPDPLALFEALADRLDARDLACSVQGSKPLLGIDAARLALQLSELTAQAADAAAQPVDHALAGDLSLNPMAGVSRKQAFRDDFYHRGNRLLTANEVLDDAAAQFADELHGVPDLWARGELAAALDCLQAFALRRFASKPIYLQTQLAAIDALRTVFAAAEAVGVDALRALELTGNGRVKIRCATGEAPRIAFMTLDDAASLPASSTQALVACKLNAESYPVKAPEDALQTLLSKMDAAGTQDPLAHARAIFARALECAQSAIVLQRSLHTGTSEAATAATVFDEMMDCYTEDLEGASDYDDLLGAPRRLAPFARTVGEEALVRNATGQPEPRGTSVPAPVAGHLSADLAPYVMPKRLYSRRTFEGLDLSPSAIESYLECPYQWFAKRRIYAKIPDEGFGPAERGSFVHEVLHRFHGALKASGVERVTPDNLADSRALLRTVFAKEAAYQFEIAPNSRSTRYVPANAWEAKTRDGLLEKLVAYLDVEARMLPTFTPTYFEWSYGETAPIRYAGGNLVGKIDRIDIDRDRNLAVVIDYKTSLNPDYLLHDDKPESFALPRKMQALVYAQAIQRTMGIPVVAALYLNPLTQSFAGAWDGDVLDLGDIPFETDAKRDRCRAPFADIRTFAQLIDESEDLVAQKMQALAKGDVHPDPLSDAVCEWCPVAVCPKRKRA